MKMLNKSKGFGTVEAILFILICAIIGGTGYFVWNSKSSASYTYLPIKEWSVKLQLSAPIKDTSYFIKDNDAFLYIKSVELSQACVEYNAKYNTTGVTNLNIHKYALTDTISPLSPGNSLTVQDALTKYPDNFKKLGNYLYGLYGTRASNSSPCHISDSQALAFNNILSSLTAD